MNLVSTNTKIYEATLEGGLRPEEAEQLTDLDPAILEKDGYEPSDIPALAGHIHKYQDNKENQLVPAEHIDEYINLLLERPQEVTSELKTETCPFENNITTIKEKRDEYILRTIYAFQDHLNQELIDETLCSLVNQQDYRKETARTLSEGNLGLLLGQYMEQIQELSNDQSIVDEAYSTVAQTPEASIATATNVQLNKLPDKVTENIYTGGAELGSDQITTRLRNMRGAGRCHELEERHEEVLLNEEPTRNNTLITLEDQLVGSLKHIGNTSMLALRDLTFNNKQVLQKGMTYRVSHPLIEDLDSERIERLKPTHLEWENVFQPDETSEENKIEYQDWEVKQVDRLELRPLRFAGQRGSYTIEEFRENIEEKRDNIEEQINSG